MKFESKFDIGQTIWYHYKGEYRSGIIMYITAIRPAEILYTLDNCDVYVEERTAGATLAECKVRELERDIAGLTEKIGEAKEKIAKIREKEKL